MERPSQSEYLVLRKTIAQRGALRPILVLCGASIWAALLIAVLAFLPYPVAAAIPLLTLVVTFEVIRPLHFGSERLGRYIQVFYEEAGDANRSLADTPSWERVAMSFGVVPGVGGHALFVPLFLIATAVNYVAVLLPRPERIEYSVMAIPHLAFIAWLVATDRAMRAQRAIELARLRALHSATPRPGAP
ncbi:MAG TPA: hypothetical protein VM096_16670 [Vicinamibacterales bacterium]|nr:hypothetical protein [Vicinamibacterales bacterium]